LLDARRYFGLLSRLGCEYWVLILCRGLPHACAGVCIRCLLGIDIGRGWEDWVWTGDGTLSEVGVLDIFEQRWVAYLLLSIGCLLIDPPLLDYLLCRSSILSKLASILNRILNVVSDLFSDAATTAKNFLKLVAVCPTVATESTCACARARARVSALPWLALFADGGGNDRRWVGGSMLLLYLASAVIYWQVGDLSMGRSLYYSIVTFTTSPPAEPDLTGQILGVVEGFETFAGTAAIVFLGYVLGTRERVQLWVWERMGFVAFLPSVVELWAAR
jgi:hypothetical protein